MWYRDDKTYILPRHFTMKLSHLFATRFLKLHLYYIFSIYFIKKTFPNEYFFDLEKMAFLQNLHEYLLSLWHAIVVLYKLSDVISAVTIS